MKKDPAVAVFSLSPPVLPDGRGWLRLRHCSLAPAEFPWTCCTPWVHGALKSHFEKFISFP